MTQKNDQELTIVTAFFDIGRRDWSGFERANDNYIKDFRFWGQMKNKLVVYTDRATAEQVVKIREELGLKDRTKTVIIDDVKTIDSTIYQKIEHALSNKRAIACRALPNNPESCMPLYNYVTYLKPIIVADAVQKGLADGMIAWIDFGFNHSGRYYPNVNDFAFSWKYNFSDKIHMFAIQELDDMPIFDVVQKMKVYFAGGLMVAPGDLWPTFAQLFKKAALSLADCGFADDDQTLQLMAYRERPDLFEIHRTTHFCSALKDCGAGHLTESPESQWRPGLEANLRLGKES